VGQDSEDEIFGVDLEDKADAITSKEEFLEFLDLLIQEVKDDPEYNVRRTAAFLAVARSNLIATSKIPISTIDFPEQPTWSWVARLLIAGSFEN